MEKLGYANLDSATPRTITLNDSAKDDATKKTTALDDDTVNREYETYVHGFIREGKKYIAVTNADRTALHNLVYLNSHYNKHNPHQNQVVLKLSQ